MTLQYYFDILLLYYYILCIYLLNIIITIFKLSNSNLTVHNRQNFEQSVIVYDVCLVTAMKPSRS